MNCLTIQQSLAWCEGKPAYQGIKRRLYYIDKASIVKWPTLAKDQMGRITSSEYTGDFTLADGAVWHYIDIIADKSQVQSAAQGEYPSQTQQNTLTAVHAGTGKEATAAVAGLNNSANIFLFEQIDGSIRVIGNEAWDPVTTVTQDLGQGATGNANTTITVNATDFIPAPFYSGEIKTTETTETPSE